MVCHWPGVTRSVSVGRCVSGFAVVTGNGAAGWFDQGWHRWDVALSFAGAQRAYVERVAAALKARGVRCFFDADEQLDLWGRYLAEELSEVFAERATVVVVFVSAEYSTSDWTRLERRSALNRAVRERGEYVLPARFDDTPLPGVLSDLGAVWLAGREPEAFAEMIAAKLAALGIATPVTPGSGEAAGVVWGPVPPRNPFFTGREVMLADLHARLTGSVDPVVVAGIAGMGGIGKTQLAAEYAWRHAPAYGLVWWLGAETLSQAAAGLAALADVLDVPAAAPARRLARLWDTLAGRSDWLLIYDNAADANLLAAILPPRLAGRVLVTSRARLPRLPITDVDVFDRAESGALLRRHLPDLPMADADRIAAAVADLPLAVDQAGAYLAEAPIGVDAYLQLLADQPHLALSEQTPDHPGLAATVGAARTRLVGLRPVAGEILDQFAFLAPDPIPLTATDPTGHGLTFTAHEGPECLRLVVRLALARGTDTGVQMHRLVAALLRAHLIPQRRSEVLGQCMGLLTTATPGNPDDPLTWPAWAALAPHIQAVTAHLGTSDAQAPAEPDSFRTLIAACASYLYRSGQLHPARQLAVASLSRWQCRHPDDPHTLRLATALAGVLTGMSEYQTAREVAENALARARQTLGEDHPTTLAAAAILVGPLTILGEPHLARQIAENALARARQTLGEDNPTTLAAASMLASACTGLQEYPQARDLAHDTLVRARRILGNDQPTTLLAAFALAIAQVHLGEYAAARELAESILALRRRRKHGDDHPLTIATTATLAAAHHGLGNRQAAREFAEDVLFRVREILKTDNPNIVVPAVGVAATLTTLGEHHQARELAAETLDTAQRNLGVNHPATRQAQQFLQQLDQPPPQTRTGSTSTITSSNTQM